MFGSEALEVAIGLALVFFVLAAASSAVVEWIASIFKVRARHLKRALLRHMAGTATVPTATDGDSEEQQNANAAVLFVDDLYMSSAIAPLAAAAKGRPSYIPAKNFAEGVISLIRSGMDANRANPGDEASYASVLEANEGGLDNYLNTLPVELRNQVKEIARSIGADIVGIQAELESWFDSSMERASGVFKRWSRIVLIAVATTVVVLFNVDSTDVAVSLWRSEEARGAAVATAQEFVDEAEKAGEPITIGEAIEQVRSLRVPIGWDERFCEKTDQKQCTWIDNAKGFVTVVADEGPGNALGWILTILMVSLGAPFWYGALNRLVAIRGTGGKPGKASSEQASATAVFDNDPTRTVANAMSEPIPSLARALTPVPTT